MKTNKQYIRQLEDALRMIYHYLGPETPEHLTCEGCQYDWNSALRVARNFTPLEDRPLQDRDQPYLDPEFKL